MKIAILTNNFPPIIDGVGDYSFHLANEFHKQGHSVSIICNKKPPIVNLAKNKFFPYTIYFINGWNIYSLIKTIKFIKKQSIDRIILQYVPNSFSKRAIPLSIPLFLFFLKILHFKITVTFHEVHIRQKLWPLKYAIISLIQRKIACFITKVTDTVITSIDLYKSFLSSYTQKPIYLIPIGANIIPVPVTNEDLAYHKCLIAPQGELVLCTFGMRNQDFLISVFEAVLQREPNTKLIICGNLNITDAARKSYNCFQEQILVTDFLQPTDLYKHLLLSDVFIIPDFVNSLGQGGTSLKSGSLAAALAAGLPALGTKGDMNDELLLRSGVVFLEEYGNVDAFANKILVLPSLASTEKIRQFWQQHLSWEAIYNEYMHAW